MKILYLTQHYPPEAQGAAFRASETAAHLANKGFEVFVITGFPNLEEERSSNKYKRKLIKRELDNKVRVLRVFTPLDTKKGVWIRLCNYFNFMFLAVAAGLILPRATIVYASSPPFFVSLAGLVIAKFKRSKLIVEVRDLWVDFAILLGQLNNKFIIRLMRLLELAIFKAAHKITVVTKGYKELLVGRGVDEQKIEVIHGGVDLNDKVFKTGNGSKIREKHKLAGKFIVGYAGNLGLAQGLKVVVEAANSLKDVTDIAFLLVGNGAEREQLIALAEENKLRNIIFVNQMPRDEVVHYFASFDCSIVTLLNHPLFQITLPSKLFENMAYGKPVLLGLGGEAKEIIEDSGAGLCFLNNHPETLVQAITYLKENPQVLPVMSSNGYKYVSKHFNRDLLVEKLGKIFLSIQGDVGGL